MHGTTTTILGLLLLLAQATPPAAEAPTQASVVLLEDGAPEGWDPFRRRNRSVERGNERLLAEDPAGAANYYEEAARQLPSRAGVRLDRGLALIAQDETADAREELQRATAPEGPRPIRAAAHYDLGLSFYREGDQHAAEDDHEQAQRAFREAAEQFRRSLRLQPGNRDAGWNLELALRRLREQEEAQREQEEQERQDQDHQDQDPQDQDPQDQDPQDQDPQDQDPQDQDPQDQDPQDQDPQDQDPQDQDPQDQDPQGEESDDEQPADEGEDGEEESEEQGQDEPEPQDQEGQDQPEEEPGEEEGQAGGQDEGEELPPEAQQILDSLQENEDNLQRLRARSRARAEGRRVRQDW